jgi:hypothetical protein
MHFPCWFRCLFLILSVVKPAFAGNIEIAWQSSLGATNRQSNSSQLSRGFVFEVGGFSGVFLPTSANRNEWRDHWVSLGSAPYLEDDQRFSFAANLDNNNDPFLVPVALPGITKLAYIWGYSLTEPDAEWILVTKSDWFWPDTTQPFIPAEPYVISEDQTGYQVILGAVNTGAVLMRTEAVTSPAPPYLSYGAWVVDYFSPAERDNFAITGQNADPDGDAITNLHEYAIGSDPRKVSADSALSIKTGELPGGRYTELTIRKSSQSKVVMDLLGSENLLSFAPMTPMLTPLLNTPSRLVYRDLIGTQQRSFYRLKISSF